MKTAQEIIEMFRKPCETIFVARFGSEEDLQEAMKACALLYIDGKIDELHPAKEHCYAFGVDMINRKIKYYQELRKQIEQL